MDPIALSALQSILTDAYARNATVSGHEPAFYLCLRHYFLTQGVFATIVSQGRLRRHSLPMVLYVLRRTSFLPALQQDVQASFTG